MAETNGNGSNGYLSRTRFKVAKIAIGLIFGLSLGGIVIGLIISSLGTIIGSSITAGITGIGGVSGVYIGGDSYRPSHIVPPPSNTVVIQQGGNDSTQHAQVDASEDPLPPSPFIEN